MTVKRFRTKIVEIEAVQFTGDNVDEVLELMRDKLDAEFLYFKLEGSDYWDDPEIIANVYDELHATWIGVKAGQWIIRGVQGEYYPCDPDTFSWKYEEVKESPYDKYLSSPTPDTLRVTYTRGPLPAGETARILSLDEQAALERFEDEGGHK